MVTTSMTKSLTMLSANETNDKSTEAVGQDSTESPSSSNSRNKLKLDAFPNILHRILSDEELSEIITWLPHGCSWKIVNKSKFVDQVIPKFFNHKNFKSFLRQVNGWGFIRINKGLDEGSYYHKSFLRGEPILARGIARPPNFKASYKRGEDPPNFRLLTEHRAERYPDVPVHFESFNPSQPARQLIPNHAMNQSADTTEDSLLGTRTMHGDEHILQTNISQVVRNNFVPQCMTPSALLYLSLEHRQREIKTMLYMEEIKRLNLSKLLSTSENMIFNPSLRQGDTDRLLTNSQFVLSAHEAMIQNKRMPF